jgi:hypothetical protein
MTTITLTKTTSKKTNRPRQVASPRSQPTLAQVANREWYPALSTTRASEPERSFAEPIDGTCAGVVETASSLTVLDSLRDEKERFNVANREWFPGLCTSCEKLEACTFPKPEGGVFSCDEFE